jgi:hypothetical protein
MGSVYHKFNKNDLLHTVVHTRPHLAFASGTAGWSGSVGADSSLSLYGGVRSRTDIKAGSTSGLQVYPLDLCDTHSIDKVIFVSGSYPATGSVKMVKCRNTVASLLGDITDVDWYQEHFSPIERLYDYYGSYHDNYFTGSYDFYCLRFKPSVKNEHTAVKFGGVALETASPSLSIEARIKPTAVVSSSKDFVIASQDDNWMLYITGSNGSLTFSDLTDIVTSSLSVTNGKWQHIAFTYDNSAKVCKFYKDGALNCSYHVEQAIDASYDNLIIGAERSDAGFFIKENNGFEGFIYETRIWDTVRTDAQISASNNTTIVQTGSLTNLVHYARFNDGPLGSRHSRAIGSGVFNHSTNPVAAIEDGQFLNFGTTLPETPIWHVNDDQNFFTQKTKILTGANFLKAIHIPSMFYGRQISTGSVRIECKAYYNQYISRVLVDDGRGSLYISGSITNGLVSDERSGVKWNKVGNVFYSEGIITITEPSLFDFGEIDRDGPATTLNISFDGDSRIASKVFMCRMGPADCNASNNPSYSYLENYGTEDTSDDRYIRTGDATTYITAIGIYNEDRKLVAVAKLARPLRKREQDKFNIKLAIDM